MKYVKHEPNKKFKYDKQMIQQQQQHNIQIYDDF